MTRRLLFIFIIVAMIFSSISAINAMDNESLDYNAELISQDADVNLLSEASDTSVVNNEKDMNNTEKISAYSAVSSNKSTHVDAPDVVKYHKNGTNFEAKLTDSNGNGIANQDVTFDIKGVKAYTLKTNADGVASLPINLRVGTYTINVIFNGNPLYDSSSDVATLKVIPSVVGDDLVKYYRNGTQYSVTVMGKDKPLAGADVSFTVKGKTYYATTNSNGVASLTINLSPGAYTIIAKNLLDGTSCTNSIKVLSTLTTSDFTKGYLDNQQFSVKVVNGAGSPSVGTKVSFTIPGKTYTMITNNQGIATLPINLRAGTYSIVTLNENDGLKYTNTIKVVTGLNTYIKPGTDLSNDKITATIYNSLGHTVPNLAVTLTVGGKTYTGTSDSNGIVRFTNTLEDGSYSATFKFAGTSVYKASSNTTTINIFHGKQVIFEAGPTIIKNGSSFSVTVKDVNGNPISNLKIYFTINGINYNAVTDSNGMASVKVIANTNTVAVSYAVNETGYSKKTTTSNVRVFSSTKPNLSTNTSTVVYNAGGKFYVKLSVDNIPLPNQKITLSIKGKDYVVITNAEGWASLPINLLQGTYDIICKFNGSSDFEEVSKTFTLQVISSSNTNIKYLGGVEYVKGQSYFTVLLTDENGNVLPNQKVIFTVKTASYTKVTNSEGVASLLINLAPGVYTIGYKFEGTSQYKASQGSSQIRTVLTAGNGYGYWLFGRDMPNVDLASLASQGTNNIFLNSYAIDLHGKKAVTDWIQKANSYGIKVHIWMEVFYDGSFISPVLSNGNLNYQLFNEKINEAKSYASISGLAGIHLDYLRFPGTAYKYTNGVTAINTFVQMCTEAVHAVNPNIIMSAAIMPEKNANTYYYGQDISVLGKYLDVIVPMIYKGNYGQPSSWITETTKWFVDNCKDAQIWCGIQSYKSDSNTAKLSVSELAADANAGLKGSAAGVMIFRYGITNFLDFKTLNDGSNSGVTGTKFTRSEIQDGAKYLKEYMEANGALPNSIKISNKVCSVPQFLYLMSLYVSNKNQNEFAIINVANPTNPSGDAMRKEFKQNDFTSTAGSIVNYIETNKKAPDYMSTAVGNMKYHTLLYSYAKIINYVKTTGAMPAYVYVTNIIDDHKISVVMYPSVATDKYQYIKYSATWYNYCPKCGYYGTLQDNPKHTPEGELTCSFCDCDFCGVTGKEKLSSSQVYLKGFSAPVPAGSGSTSNTFSLSDIQEAAKKIAAEGKIPSEVTVGTVKISKSEFLYLLSVAIENIGASNTQNIKLIKVDNCQLSFGDALSSSLNKAQYLELANRVAQYIVNNGQAPNYASSAIGRISHDELIDSFSRILAYYNTNKALPNSVTFSTAGSGAAGGSESSNTVSLNEILAAAKNVKAFYEANGRIPEVVTVGNKQVSAPQFLYLISKAIGNLGSSNTGNIKLIDVSKPENPFGDSISSTLDKSQYLELANRVAQYIVNNGQAPNYASSAVGKINYNELIDSFSRILSYYNDNKVMPLTVAIKWSAGGASNSVSGLAKSLTNGLTTETQKATALFNYVRDKIAYQFYYDTQKGADGTLSSKSGNCCDKSQLLVAMAKSVGLTSRFVHGKCTFSSGLYTGHVWVQIKINGKWVNADTTSSRNSFGVINNWNTKTYTLLGYYDTLPF